MIERHVDRARRGAFAPVAAALVATLGGSRVAYAQALSQTDPLDEAEAAYVRIDFEAARTHAHEALEAGNHTFAQTARIYYLTGMASAALHDDVTARDAFLHMLAIDPWLPVERNLAPALREPFYQARFAMSNVEQHFGASVTAAHDGLQISLIDPLHMARAALVRTRVAPAQGYAVTRVRVATTIDVPVAGVRGGARIEYVLRILDEYGNQLTELGTDADPRVLEIDAPRVVVTPAVAPRPRRSSWVPAGLATAGVGFVASMGAVIAWRVRESQVEDWNSDACLRGGATREQNCGSTRVAGEAAETWSLVGLAAGGVLVATGVTMILVAPSTREHPHATSLACGPGPGTVGLSCRAEF